MKRRLFSFVLLFALFALVASAQVVAPVTPAAGTIIDPNVMAAILALLGGGIITALVQAAKKLLKIGADNTWQARLLAFVLSLGGTIYVLAQMKEITVIGVLIYTAITFGVTTGLYHLSAAATPATPRV